MSKKVGRRMKERQFQIRYNAILTIGLNKPLLLLKYTHTNGIHFY